MLYPNGQRGFCYPVTHVSGALVASGAMVYGGRFGSRFNGTANFAKSASVPEGYAPRASFVLPVNAGGMTGVLYSTVTGDASLLQGGPMEGAGSLVFDQSGSLSLVVGMDGTAAVATLTGDSMVLRLTVGLDGTGEFSLTGTNNLALIVPFDGAGSVVSMGAGASDLRGLLSMQGEWTPFTELSPEGLASAVWGSLAAQHDEPGTMGEKLNGAGSAGNPWTEVIESGLTAAEVLRIIAAAMAGKVSGAGTGVETFKGLDGSTNRIVSTVDSSGNRTSVTVDGA